MDPYQKSGGEDFGETIPLNDTPAASNNNKSSPEPPQNEENDNLNDDEIPLLSNNAVHSIAIEDEHSNNIKYSEELNKLGGGGSLFTSFLNMANSIIGAGTLIKDIIIMRDKS